MKHWPKEFDVYDIKLTCSSTLYNFHQELKSIKLSGLVFSLALKLMKEKIIRQSDKLITSSTIGGVFCFFLSEFIDPTRSPILSYAYQDVADRLWKQL